jgi:hypothetical protein
MICHTMFEFSQENQVELAGTLVAATACTAPTTTPRALAQELPVRLHIRARKEHRLYKGG